MSLSPRLMVMCRTRSQPPLKGGGGGGGGGGSGGGRGVAPQPAGSKASAPLSNGKEFFDMSKPTAATATTGTGSGSAIANGGGIRPDTKTANPNRGGARAMTGAAASTGHEKDSKSPSKGKRNHSLMRFNRAELMKMSRPALSKMFDHYDKDRDEKLGPIELRRLARDIMRKVAEFYGQRLRAAQPDLTDADVAEAFEKERLFLLPGDNDKETVKQLCLVLIKTIDFVHGKTVSKA